MVNSRLQIGGMEFEGKIKNTFLHFDSGKTPTLVRQLSDPSPGRFTDQAPDAFYANPFGLKEQVQPLVERKVTREEGSGYDSTEEGHHDGEYSGSGRSDAFREELEEDILDMDSIDSTLGKELASEAAFERQVTPEDCCWHEQQWQPYTVYFVPMSAASAPSAPSAWVPCQATMPTPDMCQAQTFMPMQMMQVAVPGAGLEPQVEMKASRHRNPRKAASLISLARKAHIMSEKQEKLTQRLQQGAMSTGLPAASSAQNPLKSGNSRQFCHQCGDEARPNFRFCQTCGSRLVASSA